VKTQNSRRSFFAKAGAAASLTLLAPAAFLGGRASAASLFVRRNVGGMNAFDPVIAAYRKAVAAMRALLPSDPRSWTYQAAIHGTLAGPPQTAWNTCQHGSHLFWAWHRMYLYWWERIVRKYSGDSTWALPYWNWTSHNLLPAVFRVTSSDLYTPNRDPNINNGTGSLPATDVKYSTAFAEFDYYAAQSSIEMVDLGIDRRNPDYYAIEVMNELFGGGFSSRLFVSIRTKQGLAYSVGGGVGTAFDHAGITRFAMGTKSGTTAAGIEALRKEMDKLITGTVQPLEMKKAKDAILNSFIFEFDSKQKVLAERMRYEFYGFPPNFLEQFRAGIEKVTNADVARVAAKYLHKDQLAVLVVGNTAEFDKPLSSLGTVTNVDITIPPPPAEKGTAQAEKATTSNPEGKALAAKVVAALGGEAK